MVGIRDESHIDIRLPEKMYLKMDKRSLQNGSWSLARQHSYVLSAEDDISHVLRALFVFLKFG